VTLPSYTLLLFLVALLTSLASTCLPQPSPRPSHPRLLRATASAPGWPIRFLSPRLSCQPSPAERTPFRSTVDPPGKPNASNRVVELGTAISTNWSRRPSLWASFPLLEEDNKGKLVHPTLGTSPFGLIDQGQHGRANGRRKSWPSRGDASQAIFLLPT
jgi:hypothetical protein